MIKGNSCKQHIVQIDVAVPFDRNIVQNSKKLEIYIERYIRSI